MREQPPVDLAFLLMAMRIHCAKDVVLCLILSLEIEARFIDSWVEVYV